LSEWLIPD